MSFATPQDGLVPIGGGFYATPNRVQEPNYENPFSRQFIDIEREIVYDSCNFGIQVNGVLGFMRLPAFQLVSRSTATACNEEKEVELEYEIPPSTESIQIIGEGAGILLYWADYTLVEKFVKRNNNGDLRNYTRVQTSKSTASVTYLGKEGLKLPDVYYSSDRLEQVVFTHKVIQSSTSSRTSDYPPDSNWVREGGGTQEILYDCFRRRIYTVNSTGGQAISDPDFISKSNAQSRINFLRPRIISTYSWIGYSESSISPNFIFVGTEINYPPPPIPIMKRDCCAETLQLLKLLRKEVKTVKDNIGDLPAEVPDNIASKKPSEIKIKSLAELHLWQVRQLDATIGHYPIEIKIKDTDSTKKGDQSTTITVPNLSEGIAELVGMAVSTKRDTHAGLIVGIKAMTQSGMATKISQMGLDVGLANAEFLGFELKQKVKKMPMTFTPGGNDLEDTLKEKEIEYLYYENVDKQDLMDHVRKILEMVARWTAQNWRRVSQKDPGASMLQNLVGGITALNTKQKEDQKEEKKDFDGFTEQVERGFTDVTGISDTANPWSNDYESRPRVKEIGRDTTKEQ